MSRAAVIVTTAPDDKSAREIAQGLLRSRLAACVNIIPGVQSLYWWKGEIQDDGELILIIKTREEIVEKVEKKILDLHPYEVPEIITFKPQAVYEKYLNWLIEETTS